MKQVTVIIAFLYVYYIGYTYHLDEAIPFSFIRDLGLTVMGILLLTVFYQKNNYLIINRFSIFLFAFVMYVVISFILSPFKIFSASYTVKWLLLFVVFLLTLNARISDESLRRIFYGFTSVLLLFLFFSVVSFIVFGFGKYGGIDGLAGQHFSKFVFLFSSIFFLVLFHYRSRELISLKYIYSGCFLSLLCLFLVLQRGAIVALLSGFFMLVLCDKKLNFSKLLKYLFLALLIVYTGYILGFFDKLISYSFFDGAGPLVIFDSLINGSFELNMLRTRGRLDLIDVVISNMNITLFGGFEAGAVKQMLYVYFQEPKEPHNDIILLLYDYGFVGFILFICMVFWQVKGLRAFFYDLNPLVVLLARVGFVSTISSSIWMFFSNVQIYLGYSFLPATIIFAALMSHKRI